MLIFGFQCSNFYHNPSGNFNNCLRVISVGCFHFFLYRYSYFIFFRFQLMFTLICFLVSQLSKISMRISFNYTQYFALFQLMYTLFRRIYHFYPIYFFFIPFLQYIYFVLLIFSIVFVIFATTSDLFYTFLYIKRDEDFYPRPLYRI